MSERETRWAALWRVLREARAWYLTVLIVVLLLLLGAVLYLIKYSPMEFLYVLF